MQNGGIAVNVGVIFRAAEHVELHVTVIGFTQGSPKTDIIVKVTVVPGPGTGTSKWEGATWNPYTKGPPATEYEKLYPKYPTTLFQSKATDVGVVLAASQNKVNAPPVSATTLTTIGVLGVLSTPAMVWVT